MTGRGTAAGFVLVNALVLVAAMAAVATFLLVQAEEGRARLDAGKQADILSANLDAFEAHGRAVLLKDMRETSADGAGEAWSRPLPEVALEQGSVSGALEDLQGRFNINWLAGTEPEAARDALDIILRRLGLSPEIGDAIAAFVSAQGPANRNAYAAFQPAMVPLGGPIFMPSQIRVLPEMSETDFARLAPYIAALPTGTKLNVNTTSDLVLSATLPQLSASQRAALIAGRTARPYESIPDLIADLNLVSGENNDAGAALFDRLSVKSEWFGGKAVARVGEREARRELVFWRPVDSKTVAVEWRVSYFGEH